MVPFVGTTRSRRRGAGHRADRAGSGRRCRRRDCRAPCRRRCCHRTPPPRLAGAALAGHGRRVSAAASASAGARRRRRGRAARGDDQGQRQGERKRPARWSRHGRVGQHGRETRRAARRFPAAGRVRPGGCRRAPGARLPRRRSPRPCRGGSRARRCPCRSISFENGSTLNGRSSSPGRWTTCDSRSTVSSTFGSRSTSSNSWREPLRVDDDRQQAVLERVALEDVGAAGRDDRLDAPGDERPRRVLARRAAAEVVAGEEDPAAGHLGLVEDERAAP